MIMFRSRAAGALAAAAAFSLVATPAAARGWRHRHDDGIDAGDVFAGLLIVGGVAAIAAAASKSNKDRRAREDDRYRDDLRRDGREVPPERYYDDRGPVEDRSDEGYRDRPSGNYRSDLGVDGAVDACVGEVDRGDRSIDSVDSVNREGEGWRVMGRVRDGRDFSCSVDGDGQVRAVSGL
jgi:hypothetical protein